MIFDDDDLAFSLYSPRPCCTTRICKNVLGLYEFWAPPKRVCVCVCEITRVPKMDKKASHRQGAPKDSENLIDKDVYRDSILSFEIELSTSRRDVHSIEEESGKKKNRRW